MEQQRARRVVVLGARGRLGGAVTHAFAEAGWDVVAQVRPGSAPGLARPGVAWQACEVTDTQALARWADGAQVVVHAMNPAAYTRQAWAAQAPALTDAAVALAQRLGALLMFPGNVYGFGEGMPPTLSPDTPQRPTTAMGQIRLELEQRVGRACAQGLNAVIVRAGDFFGPVPGTWLDMAMAKELARGRFVYPGAMDVAHAWAYLPDLASTFVKVAQAWSPVPGGQLASLHFAGHTVRGHDWWRVLSAHAQQPLTAKGMPWGVMRLLALFKPELATLQAMRYLWERPHSLDPDRLRALIGPEPHTPFHRAVADSLRGLGLAPEAGPVALSHLEV